MIGTFKQKNAGNALFLLVYALILKFSMFIHPVMPVLHKDDNYLYQLIFKVLDSFFHSSPVFFSVLSFIIIFTQATLFNRICNHQKILPKPNFLPGMSYILVTSLLPDWNHFSAPLLINSIMIWIWYKMTALYNNNRPDATIFSISILTGIVTLLYIPALFFLALVFLALLIMRPFRIREWLMGLLGFTFPYYFLFIILYITGNWSWKNIIPSVTVTLPGMPHSIWVTLGIMLLVIPFIIGGYFVQANLTKMLIQVRKSWSLLLLFLMVAIFVILINRADSYENWIVTALPFAAFHSAAYYYAPEKKLPLIMHWITFAFIIWINYLL
ncbi:MAG: hypothetical protein JST96_07035 [Bacteroidetes bacterium]|nr:hypothetical protein [Bacteroidota bacterium]